MDSINCNLPKIYLSLQDQKRFFNINYTNRLTKALEMIFSDWKKQSTHATISTSLFWEYDLSNFDWIGMQTLVIQRVIERGWMQDFYAAIKIYGGIKNVKNIIKNIPILSDKDMNFVCLVFGLKKENLKCYMRKQLREELLNS